MTKENKIQHLINSLDLIPDCSGCGMRWSTGDYECPHCGNDLDEKLRSWAEKTVGELSSQD
ncbi:MAG: hypothetical protein CL887_05425 [Dehalococcoidia bacterium]|nr:hypothetical protein [Chloroflexota bacterium]MBR97916.1 hypothetical protein [Dehalococcoidia bacterium]|tara:strand:+ start:2777 stop:2959 length:183 start_codon:yes stop_codon:yes gene_type:complete